jgi:membrane protein DedA with SNARE-associated domain
MFTLASLVTTENLESLWLSLNAMDPVVALSIVFVLLFLAGCGLPMPEDIPLTFSGILLGLPRTQETFGGLWGAVAVVGILCYSSIILGDLVAYWLGKRYGRTISKYPPFRWAMPVHRIERLDRWFAKFGSWTVFFGRMVAGIRFVTFAMAGMTKMPLRKFILMDSVAALITVPAWIILGYVVGTHFEQIIEWMSTVSTTTWIILATALALFFLYKLLRRKRKKTEVMESS